MKTHYDIECPYCQAELGCQPSIFHRMGMHDCGAGTCPECGVVFVIFYNEQADDMTTKVVKEAKA